LVAPRAPHEPQAAAVGLDVPELRAAQEHLGTPERAAGAPPGDLLGDLIPAERRARLRPLAADADGSEPVAALEAPAADLVHQVLEREAAAAVGVGEEHDDERAERPDHRREWRADQ
jgi:hypothetical protein